MNNNELGQMVSDIKSVAASLRNRADEKLFHFTPDDEYKMQRAIRDAVKFMQNYGKGSAPYMVDLSHYENSKKTEDAIYDTH